MDNKITVPDGMVEKEWHSIKEFAKGVGTIPNTLNRWLRMHPDFVEKYCQNISHSKARPRYRILWTGIAAYVNEYAKTRKPRKIQGKLPSISEAKEISTEIVNKTIEAQKSQDPILQNLMALVEVRKSQLAMGERLDRVEAKLEEATAVLTEPVETTAGMRRFLVDRVKGYTKQMKEVFDVEVPYYVTYRQLHKHVGVYAIADFNFSQYTAALKLLKRIYIDSGLVW